MEGTATYVACVCVYHDGRRLSRKPKKRNEGGALLRMLCVGNGALKV